MKNFILSTLSTYVLISIIPLQAASLSSDSIGDFFTLPSWMPKVVSENYTPGSDPEWYREDEEGVWHPRAARLTPKIQAALNSTFEAYYERSYYALQGQSNVWDTAVYGPTSRKGFVFPRPGYEEMLYDAGSNRVVRTRRLTDYDNFAALACSLTNSYGWLSSDIVRPGWMYVKPHDSWYLGQNFVVWSTTGAGLPNVFVPVFNWTESLSAWNTIKGSCPGFDSLYSDTVWTGIGLSMGDYEFQTMSHLIYKLTPLNNPSFSYSGTAWSNPNLLTMGNLIQTNYPHADGWAITNQTRRIVSDWICCINQTLGLMDRTYHTPDVGYATTGTRKNYRNEIRYRGTARATATWGDSEYNLSLEAINWQGTTRTNNINQSSVAVRAGNETIKHRITATWTSTGVAADVRGLPTFMIGDSEIRRALDVLIEDGMTFPSGWFKAHAYITTRGRWSVDYCIEFSNLQGEMQYYDDSLPYELTNVTVGVYHTYSREYSYVVAEAINVRGPTQPGFQAGNRVSGCKVASVIGLHTRDDIFYSLDESDTMPYSAARSRYLYKTAVSDYSTRAGILAHAQGCPSVILDRVAATYGYYPTDWSHIIEIDETDSERTRDSTTLSDCQLRPDAYASIEVEGTYIGGTLVVSNVVSTLPGGATEPGYAPIAMWDFDFNETHEPKRQVERKALSADARVGLVTRVDWNWKALKRTDD